MEDRRGLRCRLLFQFPGAEELLQRDDSKLMRELLREDGDLAAVYLEDPSRPGALTAALNWSRPTLPHSSSCSACRHLPPVAAPTLGLWSSRDNYLTEHRMIRSGEHVTGPWRYERIDDASHWMQLDKPMRVNELMLEFLGTRDGTR